MSFRKKINILTLIFALPLLVACPSTMPLNKSQKEVKEELIVEIKNQIEDLGETPLSEEEVKYKGKIDKDKYVVALRNQLKDLKSEKDTKKQKTENEAKAKLDNEKKEKNRKEAIQKYKSEIIIMGETPLLEFEIGSEDKYLVALKKQYEEAQKVKKEEEKKIREAIPDWFQEIPVGTESVMYVRGTAVSQDLQFSEDKAVNAAVFALAKKMGNKLSAKNKIMIKEAGLGEDPQFKSNIERAQKIVIKNISITGYKIIKTKMAPRANGGYRTYILVEYPISLAYKNYLEEINKEPQIASKLANLKNTQAYKDLVEAANTYTP